VQARLQGTFVYATKNQPEALTIGTRLVVMKDGFVQQIDTPSNLYDYPANTYVAFYIGSPTINFVKKVKITAEGEKYYAVSEVGKFELTAETVSRFENINDYVTSGKYVTLGIRPEDTEIGGQALSGTVTDVTEDGDYAEVELTRDISLTVRAKDGLKKGDNVGISVDLSRLYIFDAVTCLTLLKKDGGYTET
ncbi:MAG: TOBE domain-containing protein, partial [Clostridia bacterium]|nr:TOBE domain-containing protein [Clostridia bacterium]